MKKIKLCIPVKNTIYSACGWKYSQMMAQQGCHFGAGVGMSPVEVTL